MISFKEFLNEDLNFTAKDIKEDYSKLKKYLSAYDNKKFSFKNAKDFENFVKSTIQVYNTLLKANLDFKIICKRFFSGSLSANFSDLKNLGISIEQYNDVYSLMCSLSDDVVDKKVLAEFLDKYYK